MNFHQSNEVHLGDEYCPAQKIGNLEICNFNSEFETSELEHLEFENLEFKNSKFNDSEFENSEFENSELKIEK